MNTLHVGGCIMNRSPKDMHGDLCDCFKIEFVACAFNRVHRIQMCREWVRYMAQRIDHYETHSSDRTNRVVKKYTIEALGVGDDWMRWHYVPKPRSKVGIEVAGDYVKLPTHYVEVVMDNRYGRIVHMIPCNVAAEYSGYCSALSMDWTGWAKGYRDVVCVNTEAHRRFMRALERACTRKEACKLTGLNNRKLLVAMIELLNIKTKEHETDEQQVSAALPV